MEGNEKNGALEVYSAKVTKDVKESLAKLISSGNFRTVNEMFEVLIERYNVPVLVNKDNEEKVKTFESEVETLKKKIEITESQNDELQEAQRKMLDLNGDLKKIIEELKTNGIPENATVVFLDEINVKLLEFIAERESKKRKQEWTISDVINYFIHFRFEMGSLNGDLNAVPDDEVRKIKKSLEN